MTILDRLRQSRTGTVSAARVGGVLLAPGAYAAYRYGAVFETPLARTGPVTLLGTTWQCVTDACTAEVDVERASVEICAPLARLWRVIRSGRDGALLTAEELPACSSGGIAATDALPSSSGGATPTPALLPGVQRQLLPAAVSVEVPLPTKPLELPRDTRHARLHHGVAMRRAKHRARRRRSNHPLQPRRSRPERRQRPSASATRRRPVRRRDGLRPSQPDRPAREAIAAKPTRTARSSIATGQSFATTRVPGSRPSHVPLAARRRVFWDRMAAACNHDLHSANATAPRLTSEAVMCTGTTSTWALGED